MSRGRQASCDQLNDAANSQSSPLYTSQSSAGKSKGKNQGKHDKKTEPINYRISATSAAATAALKRERRTREACESLRFLVFGTEDEVMQLHSIWNQMDEDGSGDVEFQEFLSFFSRSKADRLLGMRCVKYLVGNLKEQEDEDEPDGCRIEDMMRLIWLKATADDIKKMMQWFREAEFRCDRVQTPPLLPKMKRREVLENFPAIDRDGRDISFDDLVDSGLVDESTAKALRNQYDPEDNNRIGEPLLLEMLCPNGYRAHRSVRTCSDATGQPLIHVSSGFYTGWVPAVKAFKWDLHTACLASSAKNGYRGSTIFSERS